MQQAKVKSVKIEMEDGQVFDLYVEGMEIEIKEENGFIKHSPWGSGDVVLESNGQRRINIKLWKGCLSFESFRTDAGRE